MQLYFRWRPPNRASYIANLSDSSGSDDNGDYASDVDEDLIDFSVVSETLSFSWVESDDDERNYALFHYRDFYEYSLQDQATLVRLIGNVESSILAALESARPRYHPGVSSAVTEAFARLRVDVSEVFRGQRFHFR